MRFNGWQRLCNFHETHRQKQVHASRLLVRIAGGLAFALGLNCITIFSTRAGDLTPAFEVHVINLTEATPGTITSAEAEAGRILRDAGLKVVWLNCPREQAVPDPADRCQQPFGPANVFLRVLSDQTKKGFQDTIFGFAVLPALASVYYGSAVDLARAFRTEGMDVPTILGGAMAHEIGHLLLGLDSHSPIGIMQAHWGRKQVRELLKRNLLFTGEQSRQIRAEWQTRMKLDAARNHTTDSIS